MDNNIVVVDSLMGQGKTSWAIQYMDSHPEENFIYIAPLLSEDKDCGEYE